MITGFNADILSDVILFMETKMMIKTPLEKKSKILSPQIPVFSGVVFRS
jgi:hypothetical protein